jgi:hypothetical protein
MNQLSFTQPLVIEVVFHLDHCQDIRSAINRPCRFLVANHHGPFNSLSLSSPSAAVKTIIRYIKSSHTLALSTFDGVRTQKETGF